MEQATRANEKSKHGTRERFTNVYMTRGALVHGNAWRQGNGGMTAKATPKKLMENFRGGLRGALDPAGARAHSLEASNGGEHAGQGTASHNCRYTLAKQAARWCPGVGKVAWVATQMNCMATGTNRSRVSKASARSAYPGQNAYPP
jgi:hypothetical protein